jgi:predicted DNA-binding transcriptional regulator AlpA
VTTAKSTPRGRRAAASERRSATPAPRRDERDHRGPADELLTLDEVLALLRVPRSTWLKWRQTGQAPTAIKLPNGQLRIRRSVLSGWLEARENPTL